MRDIYFGAVIAGQVQLPEDQQTGINQITQIDPFWERDPYLGELRRKCNVIDIEKLKAAAYTLHYVASLIVEKSYSQIVSEKLNHETVRRIEESRQRVELEKTLREAQLQALAYQVNPHFLFNVLNTISRLAIVESAEKTETVTLAFADMMRYILRTSRSQIVMLRAEMKLIQNYLYIQKVRHGDRFEFSVDVPERYLDHPCPFMILHPIVENSMKYAVEPHEEIGTIALKVHDDGIDMILDVIDNGEGIESKVLYAALSGKAEHQGRTGIGLFNVDTRLRRFFGEDYGLEIKSSPNSNMGTHVRIRFPLNFSHQNDLLFSNFVEE